MNLSDQDRNVMTAIYVKELSDAYAAAGKPLSDNTLVSVAGSLVDAVGARRDEIHEIFLRAKDTADLPTQRQLVAALRSLREERGNAAKNRIPAPSNGGMLYLEYVSRTGDDRISKIAAGDWMAAARKD